MRKKLFTILAMVFGLIASAHAELVPSMTVIDPNGNEILTWPLVEVAEIELGDNGVTFKSAVTGANDSDMSYSQILEIELGDKEPTPTGINDAKVGTVARVTSDLVQLANAPALAGIAIYDMNGRKVLGGTTDASGTATINLSDLGNGAYVIKVNNYTLKFVK